MTGYVTLLLRVSLDTLVLQLASSLPEQTKEAGCQAVRQKGRGFSVG